MGNLTPKRPSPELVLKLRTWLGYDGCAWFAMLHEVTGSVSPVLTRPGGIPHPVHFREGMKVRNFMRESGLCEGWTDEDFDMLWTQAVKLAIYA